MYFKAYTFLFLFFIFAFSVSAQNRVDKRPQKRVLILTSYHMTHGWTQDLVTAIRKNTRKLPYRLDFNIIEMDTLRNRDRLQTELDFLNLLPRLKKGGYYDMIVALDDDALDLVLKHHKELPPNLPIIFAGYENYLPEMKEKYPNLTGVTQKFDTLQTIRTGLALYPGTKEVIILSDSSSASTHFESELKRTLPKLDGVTITYLNEKNYSIAEILKKISQHGHRAIVVLTPWRGLYNNDYQSLAAFGIDLSKASTRPFFVQVDTLIGYGAVGGCLTIASEHGAEAADIIRQVLEKGNAGMVPVAVGKNKPVFDYEKMKSAQLDFARLPKDSILLNTPPPIWKTYRREAILFGFFLIAFCFGAMAYFLSSYHSMKRMKRLFRSLPGRVAACDRRGKILFFYTDQASDNAKKIKRVMDIPDIDYEKVWGTIRSVFENRQPVSMEYEYGNVRRAASFALLDRSLFHTESVIWFSYDNAELQKTRKEAVRLAEENSRNLIALKELFEEYQLLLDNMPSYVLTKDIDHDFRITRCNLSCSKLLRLPQGKIIGKTEQELFTNEEEARALMEMDRKAALMDQPLECMQRYSGADGKVRIGSIFRKVLRRQNGQHLLFMLITDMTEQYESKRQAEETAEHFELTLHSIGDAVLTTDRLGRITMLNPVAERLMGCSAAQAIGKPHEEVFRIVSYTTDAPVPSPVNQTLATGKTVELANHTDLLALDGNRYHIADSAAPIRDRDGDIIGAILVFRDVTAEYDKRDQLRNALLLADYGAELSSSAAFYYDVDAKRINGTKLLAELWPSKDDGEPLHWSEWVYPADQEKFEQAYYSLLEKKSETIVVDYRSSYTGELRYFRMKASLDESEKRFTRIIGVMQDVTELTKNAWKLKDTLELWHLIIEKIPIMIFAKKANNDFRYVLTNKFFEEFVGRPREEILDHTDYELFPGVESAESFRLKDEAIMNFGAPEEFIETPIGGDGKRRNLRTTKMPFIGADGEPLLLGVTVDITELNNLVESERITNRVLSQVVLKNTFRENMEYIFSILSEQLKCDRIMFALYEEARDSYTLEKCWNTSVGSLDHLTPDEITILFNGIDKDMKANRLVIHSDIFDAAKAEIMAPHGAKSSITAPIYIGKTLWGVLAVAFHKEIRSFTFVDETLMRSMANIIALAQIREQQNLEISRANHEKQMILNNIKIPIWLYDKNGVLLQANSAAGNLRGFPLSLCEPGSNRVLPSAGDPNLPAVQQEVRHLERDYMIHSEPVYDELGNLIYTIRSAIDVTDLNAFIANEKVINSCLEVFFKESDMQKAIHIALKAICSHMKATRCYILKFDMEELTAVGFAEYAKAGAQQIFMGMGSVRFSADEPWVKKFLKRNQLIQCDLTNPESLAELGSWGEMATAYDMRSVYVTSVQMNGKLWGDIGVIYEKEHYMFQERDLNFLKASAHLVELMLERKRAQEQLMDALRMAQAADKAKSFFIASMSHEIRTPLNAVIGFAELLRDGDIDLNTQKEYLDSIAYSGNALLQLINDVLDLSKLEADQMQIVFEPVDFRALSGEVLKVFKHRASEQKITLQFDVPELPELELDKLRVRQILFNLIGNAVKFTENGTVKMWARFIPSDHESGTLRFGVADTGVGIAEEDRKRLMKPFVQLAGTRGTNTANNGTGLGLSISKRLAEKMGGELWIESELNKGSNFGVTLYSVKCRKKLLTASDKEDWKEIRELHSEKFSILLVDDVDMNLKVMKAMCHRCGIDDVTAVSSGAEALKALKSGRSYNLVLTDMWMPEMDGAALARAIRMDQRYADLPIVAVTADMDAQDNFALSAFHGILLKPVTIDKIRNLLYSIEKQL